MQTSPYLHILHNGLDFLLHSLYQNELQEVKTYDEWTGEVENVVPNELAGTLPKYLGSVKE